MLPNMLLKYIIDSMYGVQDENRSRIKRWHASSERIVDKDAMAFEEGYPFLMGFGLRGIVAWIR